MNPNQKTTDQRIVEATLPINRNGVAIAAGYVALFSFPFLLPAPVALGLGIAALVQLRKTPGKLGRGRSWFAVIYGGFWTLVLLYIMFSAFVKGVLRG